MIHRVIAAQGVIGLEILEELPDVEEVYVQLVGGGLGSRNFNCNENKKS